MSAAAPVDGFCEPRFEPVREAFAANFAAGSETGAAIAVTIGGEPALDLRGGWTDAEHAEPWREDTIVCSYSVGKAICAILVWRLHERGELDVDAPVATYWPEFGQAGKAEIPVRWLLTHQAGLPAIRRPLPAGFAARLGGNDGGAGGTGAVVGSRARRTGTTRIRRASCWAR